MRSVRMLAFFLALVLVASELSQLAAAGKGGGKKKGAAKKVDSKVKRTITVKATKPPPSEPEAQDQEAPPEQPEKNVGLHNEGPTNTIDMQPSISIGTPMPQASVAQPGHEGVEAPTPQQSQPQQTQAPHQQQPQIQAAAPNPIQVDQGPIAQSGGPAVKANDMSVLSNLEQQTMLNQANNQLLTSIMDSNNLQQRALANSNNLLMEQLEGNNNMKNTVLTNSGNTESVHIDGVGNSKTTHITNANNHEHHSVTNGPQPTTTTATGGLGGLLSNHLDVPSAGAALITINVNSGEPFLGQARAPIVVLPDGSQWPGGVNSQFTGLQTAPQASVDPLASSLAGGAPSVLPHAPGQAPTAAMGTPAPVFLPAAGPMPVFFPPPMFHPLPAPHPMPILHPLPAPHPMPILHPLPAPHLVPILHPLPGPHPVPILHPVFHGPHHQEPPHHKSLEKAAKSAKKSLKKIDKKMNKLEKLEKRLKKSMKSDKKMEPTEPTPTPNPTPSPAPSTESKPETQQLVQQQAEQPPKQVVPVQPAEAQLGEEEDAEASSTGEEDTGESPQLVEETQESQGAAEEEPVEHEEPEERDERGYVMKMIRVPVDKARDNYSRIPSLNRITEAADDAADSVQVPSIGDNMRSPVHY